MRKLKEFKNTGLFEVIDEWTHQWVADMPYEEAVAKYGDCDVWGSYTNGSCKLPDANGRIPSWNTAVWIMIPGTHTRNEYGDLITIDENGVQITKTKERK